jgi:glycosyltransferase involved in cell wall biosynthesis
MAPHVSVIMPTYNRADTIMRAIDSVRAQTFQDWELLITDDGSTDGTAALIQGIDPRIKVFVQENQGIGGARNTGMRASTGDLIAFLDSDDEWLPHHLALCVAFFQRFPEESLVTSEFWVDYNTGEYEKHFRESFARWFPPVASAIATASLALPPGETDDYMRAFATREAIGEWARPILSETPFKDTHHYRGNIFREWRWGWCMAMQSTVFKRAAMERVGWLDTSYPISSDFGYMAELCRLYTCNLLSLPACIKHEYAKDGKALSQDHLASGKSALKFAKDLLRWNEELFWKHDPHDYELSALRAYCQFFVARVALSQGARAEALSYFDEACKAMPGLECRAHRLLVRALPDVELADRASKYILRAFGKARAVRLRLEKLRARVARARA